MYVEGFYSFSSTKICDVFSFSVPWRNHRLTAPDAVSKGGESGPLMDCTGAMRVLPRP